jgi:hypothetical protein
MVFYHVGHVFNPKHGQVFQTDEALGCDEKLGRAISLWVLDIRNTADQ